MTTEKYLILGGGAVVKEYYIKAFEYLDLLTDITIVEPNKKTCTIFQEKKIAVINLDFESFFEGNTTPFDKAIITLPNHLHERAIELCLKNGIMVLCEKPIVLTSTACERIKQLIAQTNCKVFTAMVRRYMPSFLAMKKSINLVGQIIDVSVEDGNSFAWVADSYAFFNPKNGGVLADMGVHYLDLLYALFGDLKPKKYIDDCEGGVEANVEYQLSTKSDVNVSLKLSRTKKLGNTFEITGKKGKIWIEKDNFKSCFYSPDGGIIHEIKIDNAFSDSELRYIFESCFVEQLLSFSAEKTSLISVDEAKPTVNLIEWAYDRRIPFPKSTVKSTHLITGATGFIGTALVEHLWAKGIHNIVAPVRGYKNCAPIARFGIDLPRLDLLNYEEVKTQIRGKQFVVHLAYATDGKNAYQVNVDGTKNIVKAACEEGAEAVVILSTMNVYGFPQGVADEQSAKNSSGGDYGKSKKVMQNWCLNFAKTQHKTRIVILNPTCVYGPNGKTFTTLPFAMAKANRFCWIDDGIGNANVVYIDNLLGAIDKALQTCEAHGQNFIINDGTLSWKEFLSPLLLNYSTSTKSLKTNDLLNQNFKEKTNTKRIIRYLLANYEFVSLINQHPFLGKIKKSLFTKIPRFRKSLDLEREVEWNDLATEKLKEAVLEPFNPPIWLNELFGNTQTKFSAKKAEQILGWVPKISIEEGLNKTASWLKNQN